MTLKGSMVGTRSSISANGFPQLRHSDQRGRPETGCLFNARKMSVPAIADNGSR